MNELENRKNEPCVRKSELDVRENELLSQEESVLPAVILQTMQLMAQEMQRMGRDMAALRDELRRMKTVTPLQQKRLSAAVRQRAQDVCVEYGLRDPAPIRAGIRKELRTVLGVKALSGVPQSDMDAALKLIILWEDWDDIKKQKRKEMDQ